ncbi:hypothetical protein DLM_1272 [Aquitalea magnusonii]|uniref:Uncharacterized protein n=1 Tax=Aquitalea magnusonii TaxID=332411 RepID=A0A3G9GH92_9NEIS|nr:hypothetical protein [Aquitalea magnusonii]BBF84896.1 hypothetical protein DLM_1272 [Aquitalea magnusonii]
MKLDRELQREILNALARAYPEDVDQYWIFNNLNAEWHDKVELFESNIQYLIEHALVEPKNHRYKATAKGMDFLQQDGGLSAILGTVTVKLHADTIRDLLEIRIMESQLPAPEKKRFVDQLKELPGEALKTLTNKLIEKACDNPEAVVSVFNSIF